MAKKVYVRPADNGKLSQDEFVLRAIDRLRAVNKATGQRYKGIHSVMSGFNKAFTEYFGADPVTATTRMAQEGKIGIRPAKGGVMLYDTQTWEKMRAENPLTKILS